MRVVAPLALLLAVPLLAGCLVLEEDLDGDGDKDVSVTVRHSDTASPSPSPHPAPYPLAAYGEPWHYTEDPRHPGLGLVAMVGQNGRFSFANATAGNDGEDTVWVRTGCESPWTFKVLDARGDTVAIEDPRTGGCNGYRYDPFGPTARDTQGRPWDGRMWVEHNGTWAAVPAPAGEYAWRIVFQAQDGPGYGHTSSVLILDIPFTLPATDDAPGERRAASSPNATLDGLLTSTDDGWRLEVTATNPGPHDQTLMQSCPGWLFIRIRDLSTGKDVQTSPGVACAGVWHPYSWPAGSSRSQVLVWNGTSYDEPSRTYSRVSPGLYQWALSIVAMDEGGGSGWRQTLAIGYDLTVD